ncbi:MAG: GNAT family N-acetyltransferase [Promethearchaeota archaeon]
MTRPTIDLINSDVDIEALVSLNCREISEWHHYTRDGSRGAPSSWEALSCWERWRHGGPWLDPDLLPLHLKILEETGGTVLAARQKEEIIGELEIAYDLVSPQGKRAHIVWIVVDPSWQRKGIGTLLLKRGREIATQMGCQVMTVVSEDQTSHKFYTSLKFQKTNSLLLFSKELGNEKPLLQIDDVQTLPLEWKQRPRPPIGFKLTIGNNYTPSYTWSYLRYMGSLYKLMEVDAQSPQLWLLRQKEAEAITVAHNFVRLWLSPEGENAAGFLSTSLRLTEELSRNAKVTHLNAYSFPSHRGILEATGFTLRREESYLSMHL